ncbi:HNH endonuclease [Pedobacter agri]|uniref:HNH endonuclease n=1 Tax=Pedobacter agri TaxID=454586 RepID=UPI00293172EB|nr:HNH endonuclease [Pedobacter agri]
MKQETLIKTAYETAKKVHQNEIGVTEGSYIIAETGINRSSAFDYIYAYSKLRDGKLYTRTINSTTTDYYLNGIYEEYGVNGLRIALLAMSQHIDYYEQTSGASVKKGRVIYNKYFDLVKDNFADTIFPDEIDSKIPYSEGKTKQVTVNIYERNPLARQECIAFFCLNCQVCNFNFKTKFGELGTNFIHVHHLIEISTIGKEYSINPKTDLRPVCLNCHAMLHKRKPAYSIEELKKIIEQHD